MALRTGSILKDAATIAAAASLAGCASTPDCPVPPAMPAAAEVEAHVRTNWLGSYREGYLRFADRSLGVPDLLSVSNVACVPYYGVSQCVFDINVRYATGIERTQRVVRDFDRTAAGALEETVLIAFERRR